MNTKLIFSVNGRLLQALAVILLLPMAVCLIYRENAFLSFLITSLISLIIGTVLRFVTRSRNRVIYAKEGFLIVSLAWVSMSLIGSLPFFISGEIPSYVDALFETVSGFTTTGASLLTDVESLSRGMLFWRSFTHWIGGMGVLVFILAFVSSVTDRSIHILRAEMPGPVVGKLVPRAKDTSKVLYIMYIVITIAEIIFLIAGGMPLFDSIVHSFGTAGTGGFGIRGDSIAGYSPYCQWVITAFMIIFGINFNLFYLAMIKRFKAIFKSTELWTYVGLLTVGIILISVDIRGLYGTVSETVRTASFQVASLVSTTGYSTADFNAWPAFSKGIMFILLFTGACAGSTAGGLKLSRVIILFKMIVREVRKMIHPRSVSAIRCEGKDVEEGVQRGIATYFALYILLIFATFVLISFEPFGLETNLTAAISCVNNVGPGFAGVGPMSNYAGYSDFSKLILSLAMLMGRLEIFPILIALIPGTWRKR